MVQIVESRFDVMCWGHQHFPSAPSRGVENGDFGPSKRATVTPCLLIRVSKWFESSPGNLLAVNDVPGTARLQGFGQSHFPSYVYWAAKGTSGP